MSETLGGNDEQPSEAERTQLPAPKAEGMYLMVEDLRSLLNALSRVEGQVRGIKKMLVQQRPCGEILQQIAAFRAAVNALAVDLVAAHLETYVLDRVEADEGKGGLGALRNELDGVLKWLR